MITIELDSRPSLNSKSIISFLLMALFIATLPVLITPTGADVLEELSFGSRWPKVSVANLAPGNGNDRLYLASGNIITALESRFFDGTIPNGCHGGSTDHGHGRG